MGRLSQIIVAVLFVASCSPRTTSPGASALESAIVFYISGDYEEARDRLIGLIQKLEAETDLETAYLYLGRCYEALGDYRAAVDAYTSGLLIGEDELFQEHLQVLRGRTDTDPSFVRKQKNISRAQLACLIDAWFSGRRDFGEGWSSSKLRNEKESRSLPSDIRAHWAREKIERVLRTDIMRILPDSLFHPDEKVTRSAFYFVIRRAEALLPNDHRSQEDLFPGGLEPILQDQLNAMRRQEERVFISGNEVIAIFERLTLRADSCDG